MGALRTFLSKHVVTLLIMVVVSLGVTAKWALDGKELAQQEAQQANQLLDATRSVLAVERFDREALTNALEASHNRSRELYDANMRLQREVSDALQQNSEWSRGRVPDSVADSLCEYIDCTD